MAWTSPMTFVDNTPLTAAQLNTHLRDNLMETAPAKATIPGSYFVTESFGSIGERSMQGGVAEALASTTSTTYTGLAGSPGPSVTAFVGNSALVVVSATLSNQANSQARISYTLSGANEAEAADRFGLLNTGSDSRQISMTHLRSNLEPGVTTFTCQYRTSNAANASSFERRRIVVIPF